MKRPWLKILFCLSILTIIPLGVNALSLSKEDYMETSDLDINYEDFVNKINITAVYQHMKDLSDIGQSNSLVTGYSGSTIAAKYIADTFRQSGLQILTQNYTVTVPIDEETNITILPSGYVIKAYALWPNSIQASTIPCGGLDGLLIYAGSGVLEDFDGLNVNGSIVLMDFNSGRNWLKAVELGAKAVIFIEPSETNYAEATSKFLRTPLYFPRLYVKAEHGLYLKNEASKANARVNIKSNIKYKDVVAQNIIGIIEGSRRDKVNEIIAFSAHYDAWSVVPRIAPSADEMSGVSSLLELARLFSKESPSRTVWFVALSGHWEALAGAREFVEKYCFEDEKKILMFMGLDFSTDSSSVAMVHAGHFYMYGTYTVAQYALRRYDWIKRQISTYVDSMELQLKRDHAEIFDGIVPTGWWARIPAPYILDTEPFTLAGGAGFTIRTDRSYRHNWGTPLSLLRDVDLGNLRPQLEIASCLAYSFLEEEEIGVDWSMVSPKRIYWDVSAAGGAGSLTLKGKVLAYDVTNGWYTTVPDALVRVQAYQSVWPFADIIVLSDKSGSFIVHGGSPSSVLRPGYQAPLQKWYVDAYVVNETNGVIEYAPDRGQYGTKSISSTYLVDSHPYEMTTVVFRCKTVTLFDIIDTSQVKTLDIVDPRFAGSPGLSFGYFSRVPSLILPYDYTTLSDFVSYGYVIVPAEPLAVIFVPSKSRFIVIHKTGAFMSNTAVLLNASRDFPEGYGYSVEADELRLNLTAQRFLSDFISVIENRYGKMKASFVRSISVEELLNKAKDYYNQSMMSLDAKQYSKSYGSAFLGWFYAIQAYEETMKLINDSSVVILEVFAMTIPFAFFLEKLIFSAEGKRRLLFFLLTTIIPLIILCTVHPAIKLISSVPMSILSLTFGLVFVLILVIFSNETVRMAKEYRYETIGRHIIERNFIAIALFAFPLAVQNMRKRRLRSMLTVVTLIVITFSLTSFTSMVVSMSMRGNLIPGLASYNGLLIKKGLGEPNNVLGFKLVEITRAIVGIENSICPRAWLYPQSDRLHGVTTYVYAPSGNYIINAFLGVTSKELESFDTAITKGRWFIDGDYYSCILADTMSKTIGADIYDNITAGGLKLKVVGVLDTKILSGVIDLDQRSLAPLDPAPQSILSPDQVIPTEATIQPQPLPWSNVLIIPFDLAKDLGAYISSISIRAENPRDLVFLIELAKDMARSTTIGYYVGAQKSSVTYYSRSFLYQALGLEFFIVPLVLGGFIMFSVLLGSVNERKREISVLGYVGLSPLGVSILFMCEALVYALISVVIGYLFGISSNAILIMSHLLPEDFILNYSSIFVTIAVIFTFGCTLLSSVYPSILSSKLSTPSLERKWSFRTKPKGDDWFIPLPFTFSREEVRGLLAFLDEYFKVRTVESEEVFVVEKVDTSYEDKTIGTSVMLMPRDAHVTQAVIIRFTPVRENVTIRIDIHKLSGIKEVWLSSNYRFVDAIRKQILIWRALTAKEKNKYFI